MPGKNRKKRPPQKVATAREQTKPQQQATPKPPSILQNDAVDERPSETITQTQPDQAKKVLTRKEKWDIGLAAVVAVATIVMAGTAFYQYTVTVDQNKIMQDQSALMSFQLKEMANNSSQTSQTIELMRADQRPWVGLDQIEITPFKKGERIVCQGVFKNSGKTPAFKVRLHFTINIRNKDFKIDESYIENELASSRESTPSICFPNDSFTMVIDKPPIEDKVVDLISNGEAVVYIFMKIQYTDTFGKEHVTGQCQDYATNLQRFQTGPVYNFAN